MLFKSEKLLYFNHQQAELMEPSEQQLYNVRLGKKTCRKYPNNLNQAKKQESKIREKVQERYVR